MSPTPPAGGCDVVNQRPLPFPPQKPPSSRVQVSRVYKVSIPPRTTSDGAMKRDCSPISPCDLNFPSCTCSHWGGWCKVPCQQQVCARGEVFFDWRLPPPLPRLWNCRTTDTTPLSRL